MLRLVSSEGAPQPAADEPPEFRYWAFLSYSHHDKGVAKRLQKRLETYRVPQRLVGRETSHGPVPARVSPVFRDRDELHAGADLKASVQDALSRSRWLIVVCTPDAARSPWVNREIVEFKKLHGERRVLALIARGEPFASDMPGRGAQECFPLALRRALNEVGEPEGEPLEPIAADMRREGDGPHRAVLKLLAGMLGVAFDDLVRRDVQRRVRWLTALAAASVVGVVVFALLAVLAVQARNEAQHQRLQAEGLIEFMLGDLRKKLEPVGRLEVLDSVGEKALAYYGAQEADRLDATALGHRSRAMHLIGEIRDLRGQPAEAQKAFEQAAATTAQLLVKAPNDGQRIFDHAQSVFWVGYAAWKRADGKTAEAKFQEYLTLSERLARIDPTNTDWRAEMAFGHVNVGMVQLGTGQPAVALESLQLAGRLLEELSVKRPDLKFELAQNRGWQASAYELLGKYDEALEQQKRKLTLFREMPGGDKNRTAQRGILNSLSAISQYELALGRVDAAEHSARTALQIADTLVAEDPNNLFWRGDSCMGHLKLAEIELLQGRPADARRELARASSCGREYDAAGSWSLRYSLLFGCRSLSLAVVLANRDESPRLAEKLKTFIDESSRKISRDTPDREKLSVEIANAALTLGDLQAALKNNDAAFQAWRHALAQLNPFAHLKDGAVLAPLARARLLLGDVQGAKVLADEIQKSSFRHPAYAEFLNQLQAARGSSRANEKQGVRP